MATDDFFHARLDQMIDLRHPLAALARPAELERVIVDTTVQRKPLPIRSTAA